MENGELKEENHYNYIMNKSENSRRKWEKTMFSSWNELDRKEGSFSDFEEPMTVETDPNPSQETKQTPSKDTAPIHVKIEKFFERVEHEY